MADFKEAFDKMLAHEGYPGYVHDPNDHGGETLAGIARKFHPQWEGWGIVDAAKKEPNFPKNLKPKVNLRQCVEHFYFANFWRYNLIQNQQLANWIFDKAVNMGGRQAHKLLQRALDIPDDGLIGKQTLAACNSAPPDIIEKCRAEAEKFYRSLVEKDSTQAKFLKGWLARA